MISPRITSITQIFCSCEKNPCRYERFVEKGEIYEKTKSLRIVFGVSLTSLSALW